MLFIHIHFSSTDLHVSLTAAYNRISVTIRFIYFQHTPVICLYHDQINVILANKYSACSVTVATIPRRKSSATVQQYISFTNQKNFFSSTLIHHPTYTACHHHIYRYSYNLHSQNYPTISIIKYFTYPFISCPSIFWYKIQLHLPLIS